jgi:hypothetical protein
MAKQIVYGEQARQAVLRGINQLADVIWVCGCGEEIYVRTILQGRRPRTPEERRLIAGGVVDMRRALAYITRPRARGLLAPGTMGERSSQVGLLQTLHRRPACDPLRQILQTVEWRGGVAPPRSPRTGREPLSSSGSQYSAVDRREAASARRALGWS